MLGLFDSYRSFLRLSMEMESGNLGKPPKYERFRWLFACGLRIKVYICELLKRGRTGYGKEAWRELSETGK